MDRVRRLSLEVLEKYRAEFGEDFADNKKALDTVSIIRSKGLKNEIAGYITKAVKDELRAVRTRELQEQAARAEAESIMQREQAVADATTAIDEEDSSATVVTGSAEVSTGQVSDADNDTKTDLIDTTTAVADGMTLDTTDVVDVEAVDTATDIEEMASTEEETSKSETKQAATKETESET